MPNKLTTEQFINRANLIHNSVYDYSNTEYINCDTPVKIICLLHNTTFFQKPEHHLIGKSGCEACSKERRKQTCLEKYGVENPMQSKDIRDKFKQTMLERHGGEYSLQSPSILKQQTKTMLERHGVVKPMQSKDIHDKFKQTMLERHGVEHSLQSPSILKQQTETMLERHGVECPAQSKLLHNKIKQTMLERHGVEFYAQKHISRESLNKLNNRKWLMQQHHDKKKPLLQISNELNVNRTTMSNYFKKHNIEIKYFLQSMGEKKLCEFIDCLGYDFETNKHNIIPPYELDIFIPQLGIALEYNGLYWHRNLGENYHKNKSQLCEALGIHLIHIWEDEWEDKQEQIKENIVKVLSKEPIQELTKHIEIDLSLEDQNTYKDLGYQILKVTEPQIYDTGIWDCGTMELIK